ncbi:hypothetical protein GH714_010132 [Hevea brasiliensis]|uniref:Uncharacterized protein n=1 Tax=Hevea brasiliensis TaxID=3981 RepID=A0A6A6MC03_HEVBR|nr:hypothetical protein GH714_010132 [Hevea brasiliensis]
MRATALKALKLLRNMMLKTYDPSKYKVQIRLNKISPIKKTVLANVTVDPVVQTLNLLDLARFSPSLQYRRDVIEVKASAAASSAAAALTELLEIWKIFEITMVDPNSHAVDYGDADDEDKDHIVLDADGEDEDHMLDMDSSSGQEDSKAKTTAEYNQSAAEDAVKSNTKVK